MTSNLSLKPVSSGMYGLSLGGSNLLRAMPEPRNSWGAVGSSLLSTGTQIAGALMPGGDVLGTGNLESLLQMQIQVQQVMQYFSMQSNIEKSKHETEMAPIRNLRVG